MSSEVSPLVKLLQKLQQYSSEGEYRMAASMKVKKITIKTAESFESGSQIMSKT